MKKKNFFCERLTTEELKNVGGALPVADASKGGTDLGGPTSGGTGGSQYCCCVCACRIDSTNPIDTLPPIDIYMPINTPIAVSAL
jgi:hypothetical protein